VIPTALAGLILGAIISGAAYRVSGAQAAIAAAAFAALATAIQLGALGLMRPVQGGGEGGGGAAPFQRFIARWGAGMGLRLLGVVAIAVAAGLDPGDFPPVPAAAGFLGVLLPLLFFEVRLIR
jgi:hypothetical protein